VKIYIVRIDPVQEVAAERATLDRFTDLLSRHAVEPEPTPGLLTAARTFGWLLKYDDSIPPGIVLCRPTPGAEPPPSPEEIERYLRALVSPGRSDG
jgi:hypothetical protein